MFWALDDGGFLSDVLEDRVSPEDRDFLAPYMPDLRRIVTYVLANQAAEASRDSEALR